VQILISWYSVIDLKRCSAVLFVPYHLCDSRSFVFPYSGCKGKRWQLSSIFNESYPLEPLNPRVCDSPWRPPSRWWNSSRRCTAARPGRTATAGLSTTAHHAPRGRSQASALHKGGRNTWRYKVGCSHQSGRDVVSLLTFLLLNEYFILKWEQNI